MTHQKQPGLLYYLFCVELWERFGFYTVRGLLVFYLTQHFGFTDAQSYSLFGIFAAFLWMTPMAGGYIGERFLDYQKCLILGSIFYIIGYSSLAIDSVHAFYIGLSLLLIGNGLFKPNMPSLVGTLYEGEDDPRRDGGFTIYYMGINIGGGAGALISGSVAHAYGWSAGFFCAAVGMAIGLVIFLAGKKFLKGKGIAHQSNDLASYVGVIGGCVLLTVVSALLLHYVSVANYAFVALSVGITLWFLWLCSRQPRQDRNRMLACFLLTIFSIAFWALYQQAPMTLNLFAERNVIRHVMGFVIPPVWYQSLNPIFIILLTPLMNEFWKRTHPESGWHMSIGMKFAIATFLMAFGFIIVSIAVRRDSTGGMISSWWLVASYGLQSLGELMLSPIGLSMMTAMAPKKLVSVMLGIWFFSTAVSNCLGGYIAKWASIPQSLHNKVAIANIYSHVFEEYGMIALAVGVGVLMMVPTLKRMMHDN